MNKKTSLSMLLAACLILGACSQNNGAAAPAESTTTTSATEAEVTTTEATTYVTTAETTATVNTVLKFGDEYDVRRLKWKMSPDEVRTNEELSLTDEGTKEIFGNDVNVLSSDDAEIFGYKAKMQLCFYPENIGLAEVLYTIQTDDLAGLYEKLFDKAVEEFGCTDDDDWNRRMPASTWEIDGGKTQLLIGYSEDRDYVDCLFSAIGISYPRHLFEMPDRPEYDPADVTFEAIDKTLGCEQIILDKAEKLKEMISGWCDFDDSRLLCEKGEIYKDFYGWSGAYKVVSDTVKTYADFKALYENDIYGAYIDNIMWEYLVDINGELHYIEPLDSYLGIYETWYIGYEVTDDAIIGHFAALTWGEPHDIDLKNAEYLNDLSRYQFYDITVRNADGKYVITDVSGIVGDTVYKFAEPHGLFYDLGEADRSLITNEAVKPKN